MSQVSTTFAEGERKASKETLSIGAEEDGVSKYSYSEIVRRLSAQARVTNLLKTPPEGASMSSLKSETSHHQSLSLSQSEPPSQSPSLVIKSSASQSKVVAPLRKVRRRAGTLAAAAAAVVGVAGVVVYFSQDELVLAAKSRQCPDPALGYESNRLGRRSPKEFGVPCENVTLRNREGTLLKGFFMKQPDSQTRPTVVFFPGRRGNVGRILSHLTSIYRKLKVNVFSCDYRGFGASEGVACEKGMYTDAEDIVCHLFRNHGREIDPKKVVAWGWSLGSAPASKLMGAPKCREKLAGLVLQSGLSNIWEAAAPTTPGLKDLMQWTYRVLAHSSYNTEQHVQAVSKPTLVMCGDCDDTTPLEMSKRLFEKCTAPRKEFGLIRGGTHKKSTFQIFPNVWKPIRRFIEEITNTEDAVPKDPAELDKEILTKWIAGAVPLSDHSDDLQDANYVGKTFVGDVKHYTQNFEEEEEVE